MRSNRSSGPNRDPEWNAGLNSDLDHDFDEGDWDFAVAKANSADEVFGEVGLVLVVVLGIVLAINMMLVAFHVS